MIRFDAIEVRTHPALKDRPRRIACPSTAYHALVVGKIRPTLTPSVRNRIPGRGSTYGLGFLRETRFSEASLLLHLDAKQLEGILAKRRLKLAGSKRDRIARLLADVAGSTASPSV